MATHSWAGPPGMLAVLVGTALAVAAAAQPLADPTRPPLPGSGSAAPVRAPMRAAAPASVAAAAAPTPLPTVQAVHLPRDGAASALVDGRIVRVGDHLALPGGDRRVLAIDADGVALQGASSQAPQRLRLLAGNMHKVLATQPSLPIAATGRNAP